MLLHVCETHLQIDDLAEKIPATKRSMDQCRYQRSRTLHSRRISRLRWRLPICAVFSKVSFHCNDSSSDDTYLCRFGHTYKSSARVASPWMIVSEFVLLHLRLQFRRQSCHLYDVCRVRMQQAEMDSTRLR